MKKVALILVVFALFSGCKQNAEQIKRLTEQHDSLVNATSVRDSSINQFLLSFNEIEKNLNEIKQKEDLVNISKPGEMSADQKERINNDILELYKMIKFYKDKMAKMKHQFKQQNIQIAQLNKMIVKLNEQIKQKDEEIEGMKAKLAGMNILNDSLFARVDSLYSKTKVQNEVITEKTAKMNKAFYVIGTKKELLEKGIIDKKGFLGTNVQLSSDMKKDYFTQVDLTTFNSIPLMVKKATLLSNHPSSSYAIKGDDKKVDHVEITNAEDFWSITKYCVIVIEQ